MQTTHMDGWSAHSHRGHTGGLILSVSHLPQPYSVSSQPIFFEFLRTIRGRQSYFMRLDVFLMQRMHSRHQTRTRHYLCPHVTSCGIFSHCTRYAPPSFTISSKLVSSPGLPVISLNLAVRNTCGEMPACRPAL